MSFKSVFFHALKSGVKLPVKFFNMSTKKQNPLWADQVVAITENPKQEGIEIRFNAEPSPELQPKLRVMGFRHSAIKGMWYGDNTAQAKAFAEQVKSALPTSIEGPDLFLSPSFDAVKSNIEKKEFSFVLITLKDGQQKNFIVFESSKPKAEVIATNFAKQEFGDTFLVLAVQPKTHIREARVLFDEGKIIGATGVVPRQKTIHQEKDVPTEKTNAKEKALEKAESMVTAKPEKLDSFALLKKFHASLKDETGYAKIEHTSYVHFIIWLKKTNTVLTDQEKERVWNQHLALVKAANKLHNKIHGVPQTQPYSSIYKKLMQVIPDLITHIEEGKHHGKSVKDPNGGLMDLNFDFLGKDKKGNYLIALSHYFEQNGDMVADPDMQIRVLPELQAAEAMTFQDQFGYQEVYREKDGKELVDLRRKKELNQFLNQWLSNIIRQGHKIDLKKMKTENEEQNQEVDYFHKAYELLLEFIPGLPQALKKGEQKGEAIMNEQPDERKISYKISPRADKKSCTIFLNEYVDEKEELQSDITFEPENKKAYVTAEWLSFSYGEKYDREETQEEIDERDGDIGEEMTRGLTEWLGDILKSEYHIHLPETENKARTGNTVVPVRPVAEDLPPADTSLPNVLVPPGTTEPFHSHLFQLYDMKEVIKNNFPHLLKINNDNLSNASPTAMFELIQLGHPSEYGIDVNRQELIKEWEKRGKKIFKEIGFPTDEIYPYVNLYLGYESVEPFKELLFDNNKEGDEWWAIAEHFRPVADAKQGLKIIDQLIEKEKQEMKTHLNPKTNKPKLESKHLVRDIEMTIEHFEESKEVLQHYLDNPLENETVDMETITDSLANESGVYTAETAGNNFEKIEIPIPKAAQFDASIFIVRTSNDKYKMGLHAAKKFGDNESLAFPANVEGQSYSTKEEALKHGVRFLELKLAVLLAGKDTILGNEEKKNKQLNMALDALKKFAEENNLALENKSATPGKISVKEIHLTTAEKKEKADYSKAIVVNNWNDANDFQKRQWKDAPMIYFKVIWEDGEIFEHSLDEGNAGLYSSESYPLSNFIYQYNLTVSKMKPLKGSSITEADVKKAQELIEKYSFFDEGDTSSQGFIKGLEATYWTKEDGQYPVNKVLVDGMEFDQVRLRKAIADELKKIPVLTLENIVTELSHKFNQRRPIDAYDKGIMTKEKTGDKRKAALITIYVDDMIIDNDLKKKGSTPVMTFLLELLFSPAQKLVDLPQHIEQQAPSTMKKQSSHELNKEIESFIEKKDKEGSFFNEEEKNFIKQYTGSGGLIKEGATGRGVLYEYYTPEIVVQKMWGMAFKYGYDGGSVLEPAVGIGNFLKYAPKDAIVFGFETNHFSARIAQILYPNAHIHEKAFESIFFSGNIHLKDDIDVPLYSLVIGNPPYGEFTGKYAGMGEKKWTGANEYDQYFILRGLDLLKRNGLLVFVVPSSFLSYNIKSAKVKEKIAAKAGIVDAYRLPIRTFDTTDIGTDILVLRKK